MRILRYFKLHKANGNKWHIRRMRVVLFSGLRAHIGILQFDLIRTSPTEQSANITRNRMILQNFNTHVYRKEQQE